ncbi:RsiV family protein [Halomonas sp. PAMB 3264]|uniref:RsiV family protein n=1 Tax=Halomonas sp. PAMB 3264 TaxID=3075222 RepID=UPI0028A1E31A|nr:RsiV family protein [Halomonas sp. PAMB 3264]WNL41526.1 RsiV family protein [Halomonas sp. PAMB 3264]
MPRLTVGALAAATLLLSGCQSYQSQPVEPYAIVTLAQEKQFVAPDCALDQCPHLRVSALEFPKSETLSRELRRRLIALAPLESESARAPSVQTTWAGYANAFFDQVERQGASVAESGASEALLEADEYGHHNDLLTLELNSYVYFSGQAHGLPATEFMVIDERSGETVGLGDMLIEGREAAFERLVTEAHQRWLDEIEQDAAFAANWPLSQSRNVAPLEDRWVVKFNVYDIAPYAVGQPELEIPLEALRGIAKPRYLDQ